MEGQSSRELTNDLLSIMDIGKVFKDCKAEVNSLSFSDDGLFLATASDDDILNIYSVERGVRDKFLYNRDCGIANVVYTHHPNAVLCSNNKGHENLVKYWSTYDNRIIYTFAGHQDQITSIQMSPKSDQFLTTSKDRQILLWDLRAKRTQGRCDYSGQAIGSGTIAYDPSGAVFALSYPVQLSNGNGNYIKLFDTADLAKGSYQTWELECPDIRKMEFSNDGNWLLIVTVENYLYILNSFSGNIKQLIRDFTNEQGRVTATFTSCSKYVIVSDERTNAIFAFEVNTGRKVTEFKGHPLAPTCLAWSPEHILMVSACQNVLFWVPDLSRLTN